MKKPDLNGLTLEQLKYVEYLEGRGVSKLQLELAHVCDILADDISAVCAGGTSFKILSNDEKVFEKVLAVVKNKKDFMDLAVTIESEEPAAAVAKKKKSNIQDFVVKK